MKSLESLFSATNGNTEYKPTHTITPEQALEALDSMDDYARMGVPGGVNAYGPVGVLKAFIEQTQQKAVTEAVSKHASATLSADLISIHEALGLDPDDIIEVDEMVNTIKATQRLIEMNTQYTIKYAPKEDDKAIIASLLIHHPQYYEVDQLEDGTPITIPSTTNTAAKRLIELLSLNMPSYEIQ